MLTGPALVLAVYLKQKTNKQKTIHCTIVDFLSIPEFFKSAKKALFMYRIGFSSLDRQVVSNAPRVELSVLVLRKSPGLQSVGVRGFV